MSAISSAGIIGVWGARGSGKTTRVRELIAGEPRVVVFDALDEYGGGGFRRVVTRLDLWRSIKRGWRAGCWRVAYVPGADYAADLDDVAGGLFAVQQPFKDGRDRRGVVLVVEEASLSVPVTAAPAGRQQFRRLVNLGRHWGVTIIAASQRMAQVSTDLRGNTSADYFLQLRGHVDYQAAGQLMGPRAVDQLRQLQPHDWLCYSAGGLTRGRNAVAANDNARAAQAANDNAENVAPGHKPRRRASRKRR